MKKSLLEIIHEAQSDDNPTSDLSQIMLNEAQAQAVIELLQEQRKSRMGKLTGQAEKGRKNKAAVMKRVKSDPDYLAAEKKFKQVVNRLVKKHSSGGERRYVDTDKIKV